MAEKYYGKYRGTVINNVDPMQQARIMALVPDVAVAPLGWAMPCVPLSGPQMGVFVLPPIGSGVWIEFEQGDLEYPVWTGGWFGSVAEIPALALAGNPASPSIVMQTQLQNSLMLSDLPGAGGILLKSTTGGMIMINEEGILISNGQGATILLAGPSVVVNAGALTVI